MGIRGEGATMKPVDSVAIAKLVGVSRSTVSKVINNYPNISADTRSRILKVIEEHGYSPNLSARILAGKTTETLGFFFFGRDQFSLDPLVNMMIATVIESAARAGYHILTYIISDAGKASSIAMVKDVFHQRRIDAGIILGARNQEPVVEDLIAKGYVLGVFDQQLPGHHEANRVVSNLDDESTARRAVEYLYGLGHRTLGILNGDVRRNAGAAKRDGFTGAARALGMECRPEWTFASDFSERGSYEALRARLSELKTHLPTAFAAANDPVAFGAIRAFQEAGLKVPEDVSVIGIDDHPLSPFVQPALTTFSYDFHAVFQDLIQRVVSVLGDDDSVPRVKSFPATLKERQSCRTAGVLP
jgi:LacI family transcriptional regulator